MSAQDDRGQAQNAAPHQPEQPTQMPVVDDGSDGIEKGWNVVVGAFKATLYGIGAFVSILAGLVIAKAAWRGFLWAWGAL